MNHPTRRRTRAALPAFALFALATIATSDDARAQPTSGAAAEVVLAREAPFDRWCVAPLCRASWGRPPLAIAPSFIAPQESDGLVARRAKRSLADALQSTVEAALGRDQDLALAEVVAAIAAIVATDDERLKELGGAGSAVVRGALVHRLDELLRAEGGCTATRRLDAIYEGLAVSVALAPLGFPSRRGRVPAACLGTARQAARAVDHAVVRALLPDEAPANLERIAHALEAAKGRCAAVAQDPVARSAGAPEVVRATTVDETALTLRRRGAGSAPPPAGTENPPPTPAERACLEALDALRGTPPVALERLRREGLASADLREVARALRESPARSGLARLATGAAAGADVDALVQSIGRGANTSPIVAGVFGALPGAVVVRDGRATIDPNKLGASLAERYGVDAGGALELKAVLGLGATPWLFELNGGVPEVDFSEQKVVGDASVGYATPKVGLVGRGWVDMYSLDDDKTLNDYTHGGGSVEGWWLPGEAAASEDVRLELRLTGGFDYYDTTTVPLEDTLSSFYDFDSRMGRGAGLIGVRRGRPNDRWTLQALVGGGAQYEDPDVTKFTNGSTFALTSQSSLTAHATSRLRVRVRVIPEILGVRVRAEGAYFQITRQQLAVASTSGALTTTSTVEHQRQLEIHGRVFVDADVAALGGFVPAAFGGLDFLGISGSATSTSVAIPVLGLGIVRHGW